MKRFLFLTLSMLLILAACDSSEVADEVFVEDQPETFSKVDCSARPDHPQCASGGADEPCGIDFSLSIVETAETRLSSDDGPYVHNVERVWVRTGKNGNGWRFDTNSLNKLESVNQFRTVQIDFSGVNPTVQKQLQLSDTVSIGIDMRFQPDELNLCQVLETDLNPSTVTIGLRFDTPNTELFPWNGWGVVARYGATGCIDGNAEPVVVTRAGPDTWSFSGTTACLERQYENNNFLSEVFALPFEFHLTRQ